MKTASLYFLVMPAQPDSYYMVYYPITMEYPRLLLPAYLYYVIFGLECISSNNFKFILTSFEVITLV